MIIKRFFLVLFIFAFFFSSCRRNPLSLGKKSLDEVLQWSYAIDASDPNYKTCLVAAVDETDNIYLPATNNPYEKPDYIYSLTKDGIQRWKTQITGSIRSRVVYSNQKVFFATYSKDTHKAYVSCLNASDGNILWNKEFFLFTTNLLPLAVTDNNVYFASADSVYKLNLNGELLDKTYFDLTDFFAINCINNAVYVIGGTGNNSTCKITKYIDNGQLNSEWSLKFNEACNTADIASDSLGNIFFATSRYLYSVTPEGNIRWKKGEEFGIRNSVELLTFSVGDSGTVLAASVDFFKFSNGGYMIWKKEGATIPDFYMYQAPTIGQNGKYYYVEGIYASSNQGIRVFNNDGSYYWYTNEPDGFQNAVLLHNGNMVFVSKGVVYCIKTESGGLRNCAYPKIFGDYGNTSYKKL